MTNRGSSIKKEKQLYERISEDIIEKGNRALTNTYRDIKSNRMSLEQLESIQ